MKKLLRYALLAGVLMSSACANLNPRLARQAPEIAIPAQWQTADTATGMIPSSWWEGFADPQLNTLVEQALSRNNDFAASAIRVRRARLESGLVATNSSPSIAVGASTGSTRTFVPPATLRASGVAASVSYEIDLWGKLAAQRDAAHLEEQASEADCHAFAISLLGTTLRLYWQLGYLNELLSLNAADIAYAERTLALTRSRYTAGAVSALNTAQAELIFASQQAARTQLIQQRVETRHALAILLNQPPESDPAEPTRLSAAVLPAIAADIPAKILANRPDVHAAEMRLRATLSNVDATRASFYPTLTLTGSLGAVSTTLINLLQNPVATLGAGILLPFMQMNTRDLTIGVAETVYEEAVVNYRQRLYTALAEVEDRLSARTQLQAEEEKLRQTRVPATRVESLTHSRYRSGFTSVQPWLDAKAVLRGTERMLALNRYNQLTNQAGIYQALGLGADAVKIRCNPVYGPKGSE